MSSKAWLTRAGVALLSTTAAVGVFSAPAQAASVGTASVVGSTLVFKAGKNKVNEVWIYHSGGKVNLDDRVKVKPGKGCAYYPGDKTRVLCDGVTAVNINLGDRDDEFYNRSGVTAHVYGVNGNDTLNGGVGRDYLSGGAGNDRITDRGGANTLVGDSGNDVIFGGSETDTIYDGAGNDRVNGLGGNDVIRDGIGKDRLYGGDGDDVFVSGKSIYADRFHGGNGTDIVDYGNRKKAIWADADGTADDGQAGEKDNINRDVEGITGGSANDRLTGNGDASVLNGGPGNDTLIGNGGDDRLYGGSGRDTLDGGNGDDYLIGDPGVNHDTEKLYADMMYGGAGRDTADYRAYHEPVAVDLDGQQGDDGVKGEKDTVGADVENVIGGYGSDVLTGNNASNWLDGGGEGADILNGLGGDDFLFSQSKPFDAPDEQVDRLDGGTHVNGDYYSSSIEDIAVNCERTGRP